ncbi:MAG TPA: hypothetical protein VN285_00765 [Candidatus Deferrimicrobium sp.]|nr:hypothetical protein [Candidatus Deferrimicrobium sp.]
MIRSFRLVDRTASIVAWPLVVIVLALLTGAAGASDQVRYALCDVRVLYVAEDAETIDWPTLYYLNDTYGCRIDLLIVRSRAVFGKSVRALPDRQFFVHEYYLPDTSLVWFDSLSAGLLAERYPDVLLIESEVHDALVTAAISHMTRLQPTSQRLFGITAGFERMAYSGDSDVSSPRIVLNGKELLARYHRRMAEEISSLLPGLDVNGITAQQLTIYRPLPGYQSSDSAGADFLSGIAPLRLESIFERHLDEGPRQQTVLRYARELSASLHASRQAVGRERVGLLVDSYRLLRLLTEQVNFGPALDSFTDFKPYLRDLNARIEKAALDAVGLQWQGRIILRDSPDGPKLKFVAALSVNGPQEVEIGAVRFHPYWDTVAITLDSAVGRIAPHQSFVREYLLDVNRQYLESQKPESLVFTAQAAFGSVPLTFTSAVPVWESTDLSVAFEPDYYFVPPVAKLDVDRVVSSMTLRAVIAGPRGYSGVVRLDLETPRGLYAGAYRQEVQLEPGSTYETVRIPFSVSNLFELGIQPLVITLSGDGRIVSADTAHIRIAACEIDDKVTIGFLPDTTGMLEDVLRLTEAGFQPLTDRALLTADLDVYHVIVVGSGSFRSYPSLGKLKKRFEDYLSHGGCVVVLGQPADWPQDILPVSLIPVHERVGKDQIASLLPEARLLKQTNEILEDNLFASFDRDRIVASAIVAPAEVIYRSGSGASLLSVSRIGEGQIIYCGLPLLEMIAGLEIEAIHLLANILNY